MYALFADLVLFIHFIFIAFVVFGQLFVLIGWYYQWRWTRKRIFRMLHFSAVAYVVVESLLGIKCPLTVWEQSLRVKANLPHYQQSFIAHYVDKLIFYSAPEWVFTMIYSLFFILVIISGVFYAPRK